MSLSLLNDSTQPIILTNIILITNAEVKQPSSNPLVVEMVPEQRTVNRSLILSDLIESEKNHIIEMQNLVKSILTPLGNSDMYV